MTLADILRAAARSQQAEPSSQAPASEPVVAPASQPAAHAIRKPLSLAERALALAAKGAKDRELAQASQAAAPPPPPPLPAADVPPNFFAPARPAAFPSGDRRFRNLLGGAPASQPPTMVPAPPAAAPPAPPPLFPAPAAMLQSTAAGGGAAPPRPASTEPAYDADLDAGQPRPAGFVPPVLAAAKPKAPPRKRPSAPAAAAAPRRRGAAARTTLPAKRPRPAATLHDEDEDDAADDDDDAGFAPRGRGSSRGGRPRGGGGGAYGYDEAEDADDGGGLTEDEEGEAPARCRSKPSRAAAGEALPDLDSLLGLSAAAPARPAPPPPPPRAPPPAAAAAAAAAADVGWEINMDEDGADVAVDPGSEDPEGGIHLGVTVPPTITRYLRDYQRQGVRFLLRQYARGTGALLADDMGLGKTLQAVAFCAAVLAKSGDPAEDRDHPGLTKLRRAAPPPAAADGARGPRPGALVAADPQYAPNYHDLGAIRVLVVCPKSLLDNWVAEFALWGTFRVCVAHGDTKAGALAGAMAGRYEVVVTTYDVLRAEPALTQVAWHVALFDEAHHLKNSATQLYKAADRLPTRLRFALTGTPQSNDYRELYTLLDFVAPGALGGWAEYFKLYERPMKLGLRAGAGPEEMAAGDAAQRALLALLARLMLRRNKSIIAHQLPVKRDHVVFCDLAPLQAAAYRRVLRLPDVDLILRCRDARCPCGSGNSIFCCYHEACPGFWGLTFEQGGVLYPHYHHCTCDDPADPLTNPTGCRNHRPRGCWRRDTRMCPFCLGLPVICLLKKVANHLDLVKAQPAELQSRQDKARRKAAWDLEVAHAVLGEDVAALGGPVADESHLRLASTATCGKMAALLALLRTWAGDAAGARGLPHRALIFSSSVRMLRAIEAMVVNEGWTHRILYGGTKQADRQRMVNEFNARGSTVSVFLISTAAGGVGLNLQGANKVVIVDPSWSPAADLQAMDRAFRIGQQRDVDVFRLVSSGTIEERVYTRQVSKQQQTEAVVEGEDGGRRLFEGVQGMPGAQGELWGLANLLRQDRERVEAMDIVAARGGGGNAGGGGGFRVEALSAEEVAALEAGGESEVERGLLAAEEEEAAAEGGGGGGGAKAGGRAKGARPDAEAAVLLGGLGGGAVRGIMMHTDATGGTDAERVARRGAGERAAAARAARAAGMAAAAVAAAIDPGEGRAPSEQARAAGAAAAAAAAHLPRVSLLRGLARFLGLPEPAVAAQVRGMSDKELARLRQRYAADFAAAGCACGP